MATMKMKIKGFDVYLKTIEKVGGNIHKVAEEAVLGCHELITKQAQQEIKRYKVNTGEMKESIYTDNKASWVGETVQINAGFNQKQSMHATYMMITGTPYRAPDKNLYNVVYGAKTKKTIKAIQEEALMKAIEGGNK